MDGTTNTSTIGTARPTMLRPDTGDGISHPDPSGVLAPFAALARALADNARDFRRRGLNGEAQAQEQTLIRLRKAMAQSAGAA